MLVDPYSPLHRYNTATHLHVAHMAVSCVHKGTNFELLESDAKNPVAWSTTEGPEAIPTRHRLPYVLWRHFRAGDIFIDVNCLVAMVPFHLGCGTKDRRVSFCTELFRHTVYPLQSRDTCD
jgi:hypothetical protein